MSPNPFVVGRVTDREAATARVRVVFDALDGLVSHWMPMVFPGTLLNQTYRLPDVDEHVVCLVDDHLEFGVCLGAIYSTATAPPVSSLDKVHQRFSDGTIVEYDRSAHRLEITLVADGAEVAINTTGSVTIASSAAAVIFDVADGQQVVLGGAAAAEQLATKSFVSEVYLHHTHPTPAGISGPPVATGTETAWPAVTQKAVAQ